MITFRSVSRPAELPALPRMVPVRPRKLRLRTVASLTVALVLLAGIARQAAGLDWTGIAAELRSADLVLFGLAFLVFYLAFAARALRWQALLANAGYRREPGSAMPGYFGCALIMVRAWFVNSITIARAGDAYRAYLLKQRAGVSFAGTLGTVIAERVIDLSALGLLLIPAALIAFHGALPASARVALALAAGVAVAGPAVVAALPRLAPWLARRLPERAADPLLHLTRDATAALARVPLLTGWSLAGWLGESSALLLVAHAVGVSLPMTQAITVALVAALLATVPVTPGGLGVADAGVVALLRWFGIDENAAAAIALLTRAITLGSVIVLGALVTLGCKLREKTLPAG